MGMNKEDNFATYQEYNFLNNVKEELEKEVNILYKQLQAYKDKEDKLREFIRINRYSDGMHITLKGVENLLQILNEGSDK
jgi:hypothetical protein